MCSEFICTNYPKAMLKFEVFCSKLTFPRVDILLFRTELKTVDIQMVGHGSTLHVGNEKDKLLKLPQEYGLGWFGLHFCKSTHQTCI